MKEKIIKEKNEIQEIKENEERIFEDRFDDSEENINYPIKINLMTWDKSMIDIHNMHARKELILQPNYQRKYVWNKKKASQLIESLIINIPIPPIYLCEIGDGIYEVVDGQQRLTTIIRFIDNELKLSKLLLINEINNKNKNQIEKDHSTFYSSFKNSTIRFIIITKETDPRIKFRLFERINTGAEKLNAQEVRNAIYYGPLTKFLKKLAQNSIFNTAISNQKNMKNRSLDIELIVRFLIFLKHKQDGFEKYSGRITDEITKFYENNIKNEKNYTNFEKNFSQALKSIDETIGTDIFINPNSNRLNRVIFELIMIMFAIKSEEEIKRLNYEKFKRDLLETIDKPENNYKFKVGTNNTTSVKERFEDAEKIWNECLR